MTERELIPVRETYIEQSSYFPTRELIKSTADHLDYLNFPGFYDLDSSRNYLTQNTLPFINAMSQGFHLTSEVMRTASAEEFNRVSTRLDLIPVTMSTPDPEAINHAAVIFGFMPVSVGETIRKHFLPPTSPTDFIERIIELKTQISMIAAGLIDPGNESLDNLSLQRTIMFFKTGRRLPIKYFVQAQRKNQ